MPARPRLGDEWMDQWTTPVILHRGSRCRHRFGWGRCTGQGGLRNSGQLIGEGSPENGKRHEPSGTYIHWQKPCPSWDALVGKLQGLYAGAPVPVSLPKYPTHCPLFSHAVVAAAESQGSPARHVLRHGVRHPPPFNTPCCGALRAWAGPPGRGGGCEWGRLLRRL